VLTKEKIKSRLICAILSLAVGIFVLCFCSMANVAVYADSSTSTAFSFTYDSETVSYDSANEVYNANSKVYTGTDHSLIATYLGADTITDFKWFYKNDTTSNAIEVSSGFSNMMSDKKSSLLIKNVSQSGLYYLAVYNAGTLIAQSNNVKLTITQAQIDLNVTGASAKTYDGTNKIAITSDFVDTMLVGDDKGKNLGVVGVLSTSDVGENVYIKEVVLSDDTLNSNYNITPNFSSRYATINKANAEIKFNWTDIGIQQDGSSYKTDYTGEDYALKIKAYYYDINGKYVDVKYTYAYESGLKKANYLTNAGEYVLTVIKQESDKNYNFVDSNNSDFGPQRFKIAKILPEFSFPKGAPTYTGSVQNLADFVKVNNSEQTISFVGSSTFTTCQDWSALKTNSYKVTESENYLGTTGGFTFDMKKATPTLILNKKDYVYNDGDEIALSYTVPDGLTVEQNPKITNVGIYNGVALTVVGNENYSSQTFYFTINVNKKGIDVSGLTWVYGSALQYSGEEYELLIKDADFLDKIEISYTNNKQKNVGTYLATATASVKTDYKSSYSITGKIESLLFSIKKKGITKPKLSSETQTTFVYDGEKHGIEFAESKYYTVTDFVYVNAGDYQAIASLNDKDNLMWADGTTSDLKFAWTIKKQIVNVGNYKTILVYNGLEQSLNAGENDLYYTISDRAVDIGSYKTILVLKDKNNYAFDDAGNGEYTILWKITGDKEKVGVPIVLIIVVTVAISALGMYLTLHYTSVSKEKRARKKRLEQKMKDMNKVGK
jgi:hypothetical protein